MSVIIPLLLVVAYPITKIGRHFWPAFGKWSFAGSFLSTFAILAFLVTFLAAFFL